MSLATFIERWPDNVAGSFYVHSACLDCSACTDIAPSVFKRYGDGYAFVAKQPLGQSEEALAIRAVQECPLDAISSDGLLFDAAIYPARSFITGGSRDPGHSK
jgi:ferredoxin